LLGAGVGGTELEMLAVVVVVAVFLLGLLAWLLLLAQLQLVVEVLAVLLLQMAATLSLVQQKQLAADMAGQRQPLVEAAVAVVAVGILEAQVAPVHLVKATTVATG